MRATGRHNSDTRDWRRFTTARAVHTVCATLRQTLRLPALVGAVVILASNFTPSLHAATRTWTGLSPANGNWSTAANWANSQVPASGDALVFPLGARRKTNANDLPAGLVVAALQFNDTYDISGNAVVLAGDLTANLLSGTVTFRPKLKLNAPLVIRGLRSGATVTLSGDVDLAGKDLTVQTVGTVSVDGTLSGAGNLLKTQSGALVLTGGSMNTFVGTTTVTEGLLRLSKLDPATQKGLLAVPGPLVIGDGAGTDTVELTTSDGLSDHALLTINPSGKLDLKDNPAPIGALSLTGGKIVASGGTLALNGDVIVSATASPASIAGKLALGKAERSFLIDAGAVLSISAAVSGESGGNLLKAGRGELQLLAANSFPGRTTISGGTLVIGHAQALGSSVGPTVVELGILRVNGVAVSGEPLRLLGGMLEAVGLAAWNDDITLAQASTVHVAEPAARLEVRRVTGLAGFTKSGAGTLRLAGTAANDYGGTTTVSGGVLELMTTGTAIPGPLILGTANHETHIVRWLKADQLADGAAVTVHRSGLLELNGFNDTIGPLTLVGGRVTTGPGTLTLGSEVSAKAAAVTASIAGRLALGGNTRSFVVEDGALVDDLLVTASIADGGAAAGLLKQGAGRLILAGANTFSGATSVEAGALLVNGTLANSTVTVQPGARLGGTGSLRALTSTGGVIAPGASPGRLRVLGEVRFDAATTLLLELNGATAGTGHDQLAGGGQVSLGGCTLQLVPGFTPLGSEVFTLVANDSAWPTSGAFAGLPEGAEMPLGGQRFRLSYAAGSGNDVVLQPIPRPDLSIARAATGVWLSWPASFEGYLLESNADIGTVDWVAVPEPPILVGGRRQVQLLLEPGPLFFRLRRTDI